MSTQVNAIAGAGSGPAEPVVAEPEIVDAPTTVEEPVEQIDSSAEPEAVAESGAQPDANSGESKEDGRVIPPWMRELKEKNPQAYQRAKTDLFELRDRRSVHPTPQAAREEHELLASAGGATGIAKLREDGQFFKSAAMQFKKGDPAFVQDLFDDDPIAAALHVQPFLEQFKAKDKAGYDATVCKLWDNEFQATGFVERGLKPLAAAIQAGDKNAAMAILESIENWQASVSRIARTAEDPRVKSLLAERAKQHETREQGEKAEFHKSYRTDAVNQVVEDGGKTFDSFFKGRKIDAEDRSDLLREAFSLANRAVEADGEFKKQRDDHLSAGDSAAALKLTRARFAREMPEAVKKIARRYGMFAGPAKNAPAPAGQQPPPAGPPAAAGFVKLNQRPAPEDIDRAKSTREMLNAGRAILKNGRKVDWAHLRQQVA